MDGWKIFVYFSLVLKILAVKYTVTVERAVICQYQNVDCTLK